MDQNAAIYDLGGIDPDPRQQRRTQGGRMEQPYPRRYGESTAADPRFERSPQTWLVGPAILVPGSGHILRGEISHGLAFLGVSGLFAALGWAILETLDRLEPTLGLLGIPRASAVWTLATLFIALGAVHVANVYTAAPKLRLTAPPRAGRPVVAGFASLLIPGWGQAIVGRRASAALFLSACWLAAAAWILVSPPVQNLLEQHGLYLPQWLVWMTSPAVRWTLPVVIWALAIYDAIVRGARAD